jgi:ABC-type multidrug transport system permease subunit
MFFKWIIIVALILGFIGAIVSLIRLANKKNATPMQLIAITLDIAYFPGGAVLLLWILGII